MTIDQNFDLNDPREETLYDMAQEYCYSEHIKYTGFCRSGIMYVRFHCDTQVKAQKLNSLLAK